MVLNKNVFVLLDSSHGSTQLPIPFFDNSLPNSLETGQDCPPLDFNVVYSYIWVLQFQARFNEPPMNQIRVDSLVPMAVASGIVIATPSIASGDLAALWFSMLYPHHKIQKTKSSSDTLCIP